MRAYVAAKQQNRARRERTQLVERGIAGAIAVETDRNNAPGERRKRH